MRAFNVIWSGQLLSLVGSTITTFGLGVWVFHTTGSATYYGALVLAATLPTVLVLPAAGALVDRWDRRRTLLFSDAGAALAPLLIVVLHFAGVLALWHVYLLVAVSAVFSAFQWPAMSALVPEIVPAAELGRANGRIGLADGLGRLCGAVVAGGLYAVLGLGGLVALDVVSFAVAVGTVLVAARWLPARTRAAAPEAGPGAGMSAGVEAGVDTAEPTGRRPLRRDIAEGWAFIRARPGLFNLLLFFAATNLAVELVVVLIPPLVLSVGSPAALGVVDAAGWAGTLLVGAYLSLRRAPDRRVATILAVTAVNGFLVLAGGVHPSPLVVGVMMVGILGGYSVINTVTATLWQLKTPREMQGRVFAVRRTIAWSTDPVSYALAGPLVELVARPLVTGDGPVARFSGSGPGADIALVFLAAGLLLLAASLVTALHPRVVRLERELPDELTAAVSTPPDLTKGQDPMPYHDADDQVYHVVVNHEEQYSIWPQDRDCPSGWRATGFAGSKDDCLAHIAELWTDIRPLSLRTAR